MSHTVKRNDFVKRSRITLNCDTCGTMTVHCLLGDAHVYEDGFNAHNCGPLYAQTGEPAVRRMLRLMSGADDA